MSIRSIDMQVLIPKATEVGKQQNNLAQQSTVQQQQFAEEMQRKAEVRQHQVQSIVKSQGGKVDRDETKEKQKHRGSHDPINKVVPKEADDQGNSEDNTMSQDPIRGHIIDIKT